MKTVMMFLLAAALAAAQTNIPDGVRIRVRLDQTVSPRSAGEGQTVELSVTEPVKIGDRLAILEGARVIGTVTQAQEKRRMGRAGPLDLSIDRVRVADGQWVPLRYITSKKSGSSHAVSSGVVAASAAVLVRPAASAFLLIKGRDVTLNKGMVFEAFTDQDHVMGTISASNSFDTTIGAAPKLVATASPSRPSTVSISSNAVGVMKDR